MKNQNLQMLAALGLFAAAMASRLCTPFAGLHLTWLQNFSPIAAICLCGAVYLPRKMALLLPLAIVFVSDLFLNAFSYGEPLISAAMIPNYLAFGLILWMGWMIRKHGRAWMAIPASPVGSGAFYLITNTGSWISNPAYAKTFAGWLQALTIGLPHYPSTWSFYRSTLISDVLFTTLFVVCMTVTASRETEAREAHPVPATS
ncbi:MAG TPA: DUF6580 family putative transport protein [Chthoniobacteraceae bacterium]|nr:DUF6580 family putative transport protein [Chthoniobacteraceae bacterium]